MNREGMYKANTMHLFQFFFCRDCVKCNAVLVMKYLLNFSKTTEERAANFAISIYTPRKITLEGF